MKTDRIDKDQLRLCSICGREKKPVHFTKDTTRCKNCQSIYQINRKRIPGLTTKDIRDVLREAGGDLAKAAGGDLTIKDKHIKHQKGYGPPEPPPPEEYLYRRKYTQVARANVKRTGTRHDRVKQMRYQRPASDESHLVRDTLSYQPELVSFEEFRERMERWERDQRRWS